MNFLNENYSYIFTGKRNAQNYTNRYSIQFKVNAFWETNRSFEITIEEEFKEKVEQVIKSKLDL